MPNQDKPDIFAEFNASLAGNKPAQKNAEAQVHARVCANALLKREKNVEKMAAALRTMMLRG